MKKFIIPILAMLLIGCEPDNAHELSGRWNLRSMQLSHPVDLNRDGQASTDMVAEFDCLRAENILISLDGARFDYNQTALALDETAEFWCNAGQTRQKGDVSKPGRHVVKLHFKNASPQYFSEYSIDDGVLTKVYTASFPTEFDPATQTWAQNKVQVRKTYQR